MPVFRSGPGLAPEWCELEFFEIVQIPPGSTHCFGRVGEKEKLMVGAGKCRIEFEGRTVDAEEGANLDLTTEQGRFDVTEVESGATLIRMCGRWGAETGGSGLFRGVNPVERMDKGDPVAYPKETNFDNHFHDCDEYWIIFEGRGVAVSEGEHYQVGPGDCVATGMGHHHDFPLVFEPVRAVYFETTMQGRRRRGHLWEIEHGPAKPLADRV